MESNKLDTDVGDKCNLNGDCSSPPKKQSFNMNHAKNIDDISTPSELKFDQGIVNNYSRFNYFLARVRNYVLLLYLES